MNSVVSNYLRKRNFKTVDNEYYEHIDVWNSWYEDDVDFHTYHDQNGDTRKMYTSGMAKRVCEDWASVLYSESDEIIVTCKSDDKSKKNQEYIDKKIQELSLYDDLPEILESAFAKGTDAVILRVNDAVVSANGSINATNRTKVDFISVDAEQIIPLKTEHGKIIDVAFVSENTVNKKKEYYIEIHQKEYDKKLDKDIYWIENIYLDEKGREIVKKGIVSRYTTGTDIPLFAILKPAVVNPINNKYHNSNGLGFSIFGSAISQLQHCDITYNNAVMDFYLGGKKVFYNKKITKTKTRTYIDSNGNKKEETFEVYPDDVTKQQFMTYGDDLSTFKDNPAMVEYNPTLRVAEDKEGVQFALDMLSFKVGFGKGYYELAKNGGIVTATQYAGDRQDLIKNANKHRKALGKFIEDIAKGLLVIGKTLFKEDLELDCTVEVIDRDGFLVDEESLRTEFRQEIAQGLRMPWEYRVKFLGETKEEAKKKLSETSFDAVE